METSAVLFDLDGTLVDSLPGIEFSVDCSLAECDFPPRTCELRPLIGPPIRDILRAVLSEIGASEIGDERLSRLELAFRASYDSVGWQKTVLHEGASETLSKLKAAGLPLFLITNKPLYPTQRTLDKFNLSHLFTEVLCRNSQVPSFRSKAEMLEHITTVHNLNRAACLYVGDTSEDYHAAAQAGIPVALVAHGYGNPNTNRADSASMDLRTLPELLTLVEVMEMTS